MGLRKIYLGIAVFLLVILGSTLGYQAAGWSFIDALYTVIILVFGVGYGEVYPMAPLLKVFTILVIVAGTSSVIYIVGGFIRVITEGEIQRTFGHLKMNKNIEKLRHHVIICGYGRIGQILAHELAQSHFPFVIVDSNPDRIALAVASGYLCLRGSATEEECLQQAGIDRAKVLATVLPDDAANVFITLTARNLNRAIRIVARGEQPTTEKKLRQAGADEVVLPASIGGSRIANSIMRPSIMHFLGENKELVSQDLHHLGLEIDELGVNHDAGFLGMRVGEIQKRLSGAVIVLAVKLADGNILKTGFEEHTLSENDSIVVIGKGGNIARAIKRDDVERTELL